MEYLQSLLWSRKATKPSPNKDTERLYWLCVPVLIPDFNPKTVGLCSAILAKKSILS